MMLSASPSTIARSSLEEMLDSLRRRDENDKPKDLPPALPSRPTSKGRIPPARRSLPVNFKVSDEGSSECFLNDLNGREDTKRKEKGFQYGCTFGFKRMKKDQDDESPYVVASNNDYRDQGNDSNCAASSDSLSNIQGLDWQDDIGYFVKKKLRVWCKLQNGQWELGTIQSYCREEAFVTLSNKNVVKVSTMELLPANPDAVEAIDDLIQLGYLNEPSVLYSLRQRYSQDKIYCTAGSVLIAVNPWKETKLFGDDFITAYRQRLTNGPHVYGVADAAYTGMMKDKADQSIIICGESGAGKTETAKAAIQYLTALGGGSGGVDGRILQANCILEAFGNSTTSRNNNSSRFGKLIEIHFSTTGKMRGAVIQTFLLEKSRVVQLVNGERSFHVFYQLCAGAPQILKEKLKIKMASEFSYLNQSECLVIDGVDDARQFEVLVEALDVLQITREDQEHAFGLLASILWLGNISFKAIDCENHVEVVDDEAVTNAATLMGCSSNELKLVLCSHGTQSAAKVTLRQASDARDALAKFIYASLFEWLVEQINKSLKPGKQHSGSSINILDIYGFESLKKNGFEQFFVNYANERLLQHFMRHVFKLQQEDYELDGIDGVKVNFKDNQECLNLIEKKPVGILALLDEESNTSKATDLTFANKLKQQLKSYPCFKGERGRAFGVSHYAGEVVYDTNGFLEKNRDLLKLDSIQLFSSSSCKLLKLFASQVLNHSEKPAAASKPSFGAKYKVLLFDLLHKLERTRHHFICCIRPNKNQVSGLFEEELVLQQLKYYGILEAVRISRSGYPTRMTHQEFADRYGFFLNEIGEARDPLSTSIAVLQRFNIHPEMYQVGYTKLFFRTEPIRALEERREQVLQGVLGVQKCVRGFHARLYFHELKSAATAIQSFIRDENVRRRFGIQVKRCELSVPKNDKLLAAKQVQSKSNTNRKISEEQGRFREGTKAALPSTLAELQKRLVEAEATIEKKEEENAALREQVHQFEAKWLEYEAKMKSMEDTWQKQMASLQMSLAAAKRSLASENALCPPVRVDVHSPPHYYDSEDTTSMGSRTPSGSTPMKFSGNYEVGTGREMNGTLVAVNNLVKEFEQRKHAFDVDAKALAEAKPGHAAPNMMNPDEEYRKIKVRFEMWKKEYKVRLRETKVKLQKQGGMEGAKFPRKWWEKFSTRAS